MKKGLVLMFGLLLSVFITAGAADFSELFRTAKIAFEKVSHDFGTIDKGEPVTAAFRFENKGDEALIITEVKTSCGCTVSDYPKDPVAPGASGVIKATYNAAKAGVFTKSVTVYTNEGEKPLVLTLKGEVK